MILPTITPFGAVERRRYDHETKTVVTQRITEIGGIIDANREAYDKGGLKGEEGDFWLYARIPNDVLVDFWREYRCTSGRTDWFGPLSNDEDYTKFIARRLNDPDYRYLRTTPGRL